MSENFVHFYIGYNLSYQRSNGRCRDRMVIKSPKQRLETYCFWSVSSSYYYYYWLSLPNKKQSLGDILFLLRFFLLFLLLLFFFFSTFLSADHELVHGRSQELQDRISWNLVEL